MKTLRSLSFALMFLLGGLLGPAPHASANTVDSSAYLYYGLTYQGYANFYASMGNPYYAYVYEDAAQSYFGAAYAYGTATPGYYAYNAYLYASYARDYWYLAYLYGMYTPDLYGYYASAYATAAQEQAAYAFYLSALGY